MPKKKPAADTDAPSFEESLAELEQVVADLESGELGLDQSLERYETGVARLRQCHARLEAAQRKIELLTGVDAQGNAVTRPLDDDAGGSLEEKGAARGKRRSTKPSAPSGGAGVDDHGSLF
ncbi:Exodeoxyribonuclease 7 small subunit [Pirellulimonas nuda]|uniref:Exodeoxyribonuclease 7 small subunit n=1 Tax=Pirellulimonas nuda TaxID=2528009 RepID=A0A518D781_9BACT|nr:exodeoxyribonuclease VII small subunit [Pirellulimonas nuda]QDU87344.1 Exodeoxyribonuclease 7 small subunit [Pirellulimonas nuda]